MIRSRGRRPPRLGSGRGARSRLLTLLIERQENRCFYCRSTMRRRHEPGVRQYATLDEKLPRWMGGLVNEENCVAACRLCNHRKGPLDAETFIALRRDTPKLEAALRAANHLASLVAMGDPMAKQRLETALRAAGLVPA